MLNIPPLYIVAGVAALVLFLGLSFWWSYWRASRSAATTHSAGSGDEETLWRMASPKWARADDLRPLIAPRGTEHRISVGYLTPNLSPTVGAFRKETRQIHLCLPKYRSLMLITPSGGGKTPRGMVPIVLAHTGPALLASVKFDLYELTIQRRSSQGKVWLFDPTGISGQQACRWSPLAHIHTYADAKRAAGWLCESSKADARGLEGQQYWDYLGKQALAPLMWLASRTNVDRLINSELTGMAAIKHWLLTKDEYTTVRNAVAACGDHDALDEWSVFADADRRQQDSVVGTAGTILEAWTHPSVRATVDVSSTADLSRPELNIDELLAGNNTLYMIAPASEQETFTPLFETLVNAVMRAKENEAAANGGRPGPRTLLLGIDEAANVAPLRKLDQIASKGAGEGTLVVTVWQDESQIAQLYGPERAKTVKSNHWMKIYLPGINDPDTLNNLTRMVGQDTMVYSDTSSGDNGRSISHRRVDKDLAPSEFIRTLDTFEGHTGAAIGIAGGLKPIRLRLVAWYEDDIMRNQVGPAAANFDDMYRTEPVTVGAPTTTWKDR